MRDAAASIPIPLCSLDLWVPLTSGFVPHLACWLTEWSMDIQTRLLRSASPETRSASGRMLSGLLGSPSGRLSGVKASIKDLTSSASKSAAGASSSMRDRTLGATKAAVSATKAAATAAQAMNSKASDAVMQYVPGTYREDPNAPKQAKPFVRTVDHPIRPLLLISALSMSRVQVKLRHILAGKRTHASAAWLLPSPP